MSNKSRKGQDAVVLNSKDQLTTALRPLQVGDFARLLVGEAVQESKINIDVALCHKFAIRNVTLGEELTKYGKITGAASKSIPAGVNAHVHNIKYLRGHCQAKLKFDGIC